MINQVTHSSRTIVKEDSKLPANIENGKSKGRHRRLSSSSSEHSFRAPVSAKKNKPITVYAKIIFLHITTFGFNILIFQGIYH